ANFRHTDDARLFEVGPVYLPREGAKLPDEPVRLAFAMTGKRQPEFWGEPGNFPVLSFFDLKGVVEALAADLHLPNASYRRAASAYLHPGKAAELLIDGQPVGTFGELQPKVWGTYGLDGRTVLAGELDLQGILAQVPARCTYRPLPRF